ncbi:TIGR02678 family protein [Streptomyces sp. NBC_01551]|uniref:DUF2398 family protein n=1 Tax=Streptomyces sp. NBC_01551 TaxID=2975876 RepID=UPI002252EA1D|nr:DUF2398 family protein [Streptomyces sp. NBC_01551]MCX4529332.1 TIGR02678 family protein [Streptomyces sp. NBC_01551]
MAAHRVAASVETADLGSYQQAARLMLLHGFVTESYPRAKALALVLQWADELGKDFRDLFGYSLQTSARHARLLRRLDGFDDSQAFLTVKSKRPFDRRRLAYLCLVLACLHRSRVEINLADLVKLLAPSANAIEHLGFDATAPGHKDAVVDVMDWLVDRGALRISDGSMEDWARDHDRGDALFDIDHNTCAALFRPSKPLQHLASAAGLLDTPTAGTGRDPRRRLAAQRARRLLIEYPVVYFGDTDTETAAALRQPTLAEDLTRLTGLPVERRAEGVMLVDTTGHFTDKRFPGRGGAVNRTAGLILAKVADLREDPDRASSLRYLLPPDPGEEHADLLSRIDMALPQVGTLEALAHDLHTDTGHDTDDTDPAAPEQERQASLPFVEHSSLEQMITELYEEFGPSSFTNKWQADPGGLLAEAVALLADLRLVHIVPGGVLVRPAAGRYRNITAVLPRPAHDGQFALDFPLEETSR